MERVYQRGRTRPRSYTPRSTRQQELPEIKLFHPKKMLVQLIASVVVFAFAYTVQFFNNPFCNWVKNEVAYTLNYTVRVESVYKSAQELGQFLTGKIQEGQIYINTNLPQPEPSAAPANGAASPESSPTPTDNGTQAQPSPLPDLTQQPNEAPVPGE